MSNSAVFQTQLASVIDTMAKTAMTEIIKLVDDYSAILRWEMFRSQNENEGLRKKLEAMKNERLVIRGENSAGAGGGTGNGRSAGTLISETSLGPGLREVPEFDGGNPLFPGSGAASQDCVARGDGERTYGRETALHVALLKDEPAVLPAGEQELLLIKEEGPEEELRTGDGGGQLEASVDRKWEEQGALQCPPLPVARKQAPEQQCEEEWAGHYPPAEEPPRPHRTGPCVDPLTSFESARHGPQEQNPKTYGGSERSEEQNPKTYGGSELSDKQNPKTYGRSELSEGSLAGPCSDFIVYDGAGARGHTEAEELLFCCTAQPQGALLPYGPTDPAALTQSNPHPPGKSTRAEKQLSCMYCGKSFPYLSYLKRHLSNHTGERPHRCAQCGRCFIRRSHLVRHQQVHSGVKPFDCALCGRRFARLSHLDRHLSTHV